MSLEMGMFIYAGEPGERYSVDSMLFVRWFVQFWLFSTKGWKSLTERKIGNWARAM